MAGGGDPFRRYPPLVPDRVTQGPRYFHKFTPMSAPVTEALVKYVGLTELVHCVLLWTTSSGRSIMLVKRFGINNLNKRINLSYLHGQTEIRL